MTITAPTAMVRPIGAPVSGSVPAGLTPPPAVLALGLAGGETSGLSPPGGTVSTLAVGVDGLGAGDEGVADGDEGVVDGEGLGLSLP
jgi:hypothetical protein